MSKKSKKQRARKRAKIGTVVKHESSEVLLKKQGSSSVRKDAIKYLEAWNQTQVTKTIKKETELQPTWKFNKTRQVWILKNMYNLEKIPAKSFKILIPYIETMQGDGKNRVRQEAQELLENKTSIPFDELEEKLIEEAETEKEKQELKDKILGAKIKRIEKVLDKLAEN